MNFRKTSYKSYSDYHHNITQNTYDKFVLEYAEMWEWNKKTYKEIIKNNIIPFCKFCKQGGKILIAGCGTGRDYKILSEKGFSCLGIDYSKSMLDEAKRRTNGNFLRMDVKDYFSKDQYDGIYCESAITHLSKKNARLVLSNFFKNLTNEGILYAAVKIGEPGIYVSDDLGGKRYYLIHDKDKFCKLVNNTGFDIIETIVSDHTDVNRPKWLSIVARKKTKK